MVSSTFPVSDSSEVVMKNGREQSAIKKAVRSEKSVECTRANVRFSMILASEARNAESVAYTNQVIGKL